jgi:hypothetical protein
MYAFRFSTLTGKSSIHAPSCPQAQKTTPWARNPAVIELVQADSPEAVRAAKVAEGHDGDWRPLPTICKCAR